MGNLTKSHSGERVLYVLAKVEVKQLPSSILFLHSPHTLSDSSLLLHHVFNSIRASKQNSLEHTL